MQCEETTENSELQGEDADETVTLSSQASDGTEPHAVRLDASSLLRQSQKLMRTWILGSMSES